jgi:TRAP-type transport system periplasmic protein
MKNAWKFGLVLLILLGLTAGPVTAEVYKFKISVDTTMNHPRNQGLLKFIELVKEKSGGKLVPELFHSAQLYKDTHVPKALSLGTVEMAVPGIWQLESYDPNASITALPMFYGQPPEATERLVDGAWGKAIGASLGKKMRVKVLSGWYELGYIHVHFVKKEVKSLEDFKGLKIRYFGSAVNAKRIKAYGGSPMMVSWADVPMALVQGTVDGLITTMKSADSAKLDEAGMKYSVKDYEFLGYYVPMVSLKFWNKLPKDLQKIMEDAWAGQFMEQRKMARKMQADAEGVMKKRSGLKIFEPDQATLTKWRNHIMPAQAPFIKKIGMDPDLVDMAKKELGIK